MLLNQYKLVSLNGLLSCVLIGLFQRRRNIHRTRTSVDEQFHLLDSPGIATRSRSCDCQSI